MTDNPFRRAEPTFLEHWSEGMTALAPAAVSVVLTLREARALGSVQSVWGQWFGPPDRQGLASLRVKLAQLFRSKPAGGAIRLGSRSPKDTDLALSQGLFADRTECAFQLLTDGSKRLAWDLREAIAHNHRPSLYLRTWIPHAAWEEIRLFFFNRSCTGGSAPVYASIPDDYPVHALARRVSEFARRLGRTLSLPHCIAEVLAPHAGDEVFLLDINPFHPSTDAALYTWTLERLRHGRFGGLLKYRSGNRVRAIPLVDREARSYSRYLILTKPIGLMTYHWLIGKPGATAAAEKIGPDDPCRRDKMQPARQSTLYESLEALPEGLTGEILNGRLYAWPRPSGAHINAGSVLGGELFGPFQSGRGGPGGWWIQDEPEIHFVRNVEVVVPDLAGWRRERMPYLPEDQRYEVVPDWVCEILSPSTAGDDRKVKMPLYAHYGVPYVWLIDPIERALEAYRLNLGAWVGIGRFADTDRISIPPFEAVSLDLGTFWPPRRPALV